MNELHRVGQIEDNPPKQDRSPEGNWERQQLDEERKANIARAEAVIKECDAKIKLLEGTENLSKSGQIELARVRSDRVFFRAMIENGGHEPTEDELETSWQKELGQETEEDDLIEEQVVGRENGLNQRVGQIVQETDDSNAGQNEELNQLHLEANNVAGDASQKMRAAASLRVAGGGSPPKEPPTDLHTEQGPRNLDGQFEQELAALFDRDRILREGRLNPLDDVRDLIATFKEKGWKGIETSQGQLLNPDQIIALIGRAEEKTRELAKNGNIDENNKDSIKNALEEIARTNAITRSLGLREAVVNALGGIFVIARAQGKQRGNETAFVAEAPNEMGSDEYAQAQFEEIIGMLDPKDERYNYARVVGSMTDRLIGKIQFLNQNRWGGIKNSSGEISDPNQLIDKINALRTIVKSLPDGRVSGTNREDVVTDISSLAANIGITRSFKFRDAVVRAIISDETIRRWQEKNK